MSKLGIHVASSKRSGFGDLLTAGSPLVVAVDQNVIDEVHLHKAIVAYRTQKSPMGEDNPASFMDQSLAIMPAIAQDWMNSLRPLWAQNPNADYYLVNNEQDIGTLDQAQKLNAFHLTCMQIADSWNLKVGICSFSTGNPSDDAGLTLEQRWQPMLPAIRYCADHGHVVVLHAHALGVGLINSGEDLALRHQRTLRYFASQGLYPKVIIGELSNGVGGVEPDLAVYLQNVEWWDGQVMASPWKNQVLGSALYGFNAAETIVTAVPDLVAYISAHPTPVLVESPDNTTVPTASQIVDSTLHIWTLGATAAHGKVILRDGVQYLGGQGVLLLYFSKKVYAKNDLGSWYVTKPESSTPNWILASDPRAIESADDTLVPPAGKIVDAALNTWTLGTSSAHGFLLLKNGGQWAGGQGVLLLYHNHQVYTKNDTNMWFMATATTWQPTADPRVGMDVSLYQKTIQWSIVPASFAFIKATESNNIIDPYFRWNWANCKIPRGAYHFYRFGATPQSQAALFIGAVSNNYGELPLVVDVEDTQTAPNLNDLKTFVDLVQNTTKRKVLVYTGAWYFAKYGLTAPAWLSALDLWVADYSTNAILALPKGWTTYKFRQYTSSGTMNGITGNVDLDTFNGVSLQDYIKTVPYTPPITDIRGLHMRADGNSPLVDFQCITTAKLNGAKIMTNTSFDELASLLTLVPAKNIVLRLFAAGDNPALGNAATFYDQQLMWLTRFSQMGGQYIEIHNEPNLPQEGLGTFWNDATGFATFYTGVANLIRKNFPALKLMYPGLSPQANTPSFIATIPALINAGLVDVVGAHAYWINLADMNSVNGGRYYRKLMGMGKPVIISEFANVGNTDSDTMKGQQYKSYYASLESDVLAAYCFVSSASDPAFSSQTWVRNGIPTAIPAAAGA